MANLMQISSAFGRTLESLDRTTMTLALYPALLQLKNKLDSNRLDAAIAACAEGYPFPTNLDTDSPVNGMAGESQAELVRRAIQDNLSLAKFEEVLLSADLRRQALA